MQPIIIILVIATAVLLLIAPWLLIVVAPVLVLLFTASVFAVQVSLRLRRWATRKKRRGASYLRSVRARTVTGSRQVHHGTPWSRA